MSSAASLTAVTDNTNTSGTILDAGFRGERPGINCVNLLLMTFFALSTIIILKYLNDSNDQEPYIGDPLELLEEVFGEEGDRSVLGGLDRIVGVLRSIDLIPLPLSGDRRACPVCIGMIEGRLGCEMPEGLLEPLPGIPMWCATV